MHWLDEILPEGEKVDTRFFNLVELTNEYKFNAIYDLIYDIDANVNVYMDKVEIASLKIEAREGMTDEKFFEVVKDLRKKRIAPPPKAVWEMGQKEMAKHIMNICKTKDDE